MAAIGATRIGVDQGGLELCGSTSEWRSPRVWAELASQNSDMGKHRCHQHHATRRSRETRSGAGRAPSPARRPWELKSRLRHMKRCRRHRSPSKSELSEAPEASARHCASPSSDLRRFFRPPSRVPNRFVPPDIAFAKSRTLRRPHYSPRLRLVPWLGFWSVCNRA